MTGKEKCEFLKEIRCKMAAENGMPYKPRDCHHEGDCLGTCPLCEAEAAYLLSEIKKKEREGNSIKIDEEAIDLLKIISENDTEVFDEDDGNDKDFQLDDITSTEPREDVVSDYELEENEIRFRLKNEKLLKKKGLWGRFSKWLSSFRSSEIETEGCPEPGEITWSIEAGTWISVPKRNLHTKRSESIGLDNETTERMIDKLNSNEL